jgi:hypothetical protein
MRTHNLVFSQQSTDELVMNVSGSDGQPVTSLRLQAGDVENLTAALGHFRTNMTPEIARAAPDITHVGPFDPMWCAVRLEGHTALFLRHPGLGWLMFALPEQESVALGNTLLGDARPPVAANAEPASWTDTFPIKTNFKERVSEDVLATAA